MKSYNPYCRQTENGGTPTKTISNLAFTKKELIDNYLFGFNLTDAQGNPYPESLFVHHINAAISWLEGLLDIQLSIVNILEVTQRLQKIY